MMETLVTTKVEGRKGDSAAEAAGELLRMRQSQAAASKDAAAGSDVGTVVSKAKRAASSLWLLLHAQGCRLSGDQCPHTGCDDAKLILLHIKTCPVENCADCPVNYKGCLQSRKLLDHYRKCKDMRARQAGSSRRAQPHVCLVCSLVARQARNVLDGAKTTPPPTVAHKAASGSRKAMASFSLKQPPADNTVVVPKLDSSSTESNMPPPPPRAPNGSTEPVDIPTKNASNDDDADIMNHCESPPSSYQLKRPGLAALAAAASPSMEEEHAGRYPSLLGKSFDSSKIAFLIDASQTETTHALPFVEPKTTRRPRSESVDVATVSRTMEQQGADYDPTLESELTREVDPTSSRVEAQGPRAAVATRRRSASMGAVTTSGSGDLTFSGSGSGSPCDTIEEERVPNDEAMFLMEEETNI